MYIINLVIPTVIKNFENLPIANSQPDLKKRRRLAREFDLRWRRNLYAFSNEVISLMHKIFNKYFTILFNISIAV